MKKISCLVVTFLFMLVLIGCNSRGSSKKETIAASDSVTVPDTGFTGISLSKRLLLKTVSDKD
jgi:hypothetical protein